MMNLRLRTLVAMTTIIALGALGAGTARAERGVTEKGFGQVDGVPVSLYTLTNSKGMRVSITNYGGIIVSLVVPDRHGKEDDVVLGYEAVEDYVKDTPYFGGARRPLRQPHRQREVLPCRTGIHAGSKRSREPPPWR